MSPQNLRTFMKFLGTVKLIARCESNGQADTIRILAQRLEQSFGNFLDKDVTDEVLKKPVVC